MITTKHELNEYNSQKNMISNITFVSISIMKTLVWSSIQNRHVSISIQNIRLGLADRIWFVLMILKHSKTI